MKEVSGAERDTTNNRMEIMAAIRALESLKFPCNVTIFTDSKYLQNGISKWIGGWKRQGWVKHPSGAPVKNADLWKALDAATQPHTITWKWVRGHNGNPDNERCDRLACNALEALQRLKPMPPARHEIRAERPRQPQALPASAETAAGFFNLLKNPESSDA